MKFELNSNAVYIVSTMTYKKQTNRVYVCVEHTTALLTLTQVFNLVPKHNLNILESGSITIYDTHHITIEYVNEETGIKVINQVYEFINE